MYTIQSVEFHTSPLTLDSASGGTALTKSPSETRQVRYSQKGKFSLTIGLGTQLQQQLEVKDNE